MLNQETRGRYKAAPIVLKPGETIETSSSFFRYADDGDSSNFFKLSNVRVMEKYSGTENVPDEVIEQEKNNAIAKFSVTVALQ